MLAELSKHFNLVHSRYKKISQDHVFRFWPELNLKEKRALLQQAENLDLAFIDQFKELVKSEAKIAKYVPGTLKPFPVIPLPVTAEQKKRRKKAMEIGEQLLRQGKAGAVMVAGGQGTRLGYDGPKGTFPIGPVSKRTIFQYHIEKIVALERRYGHSIPLYIMTSESNHDQTLRYFKQNRFFGRAEDLFIFFQQMELPPLDRNGKLILDQKWRISTSPDGHGGLLNAIKRYHLVDDMQQRGVEILFYFQVDNVIVRICDPVFLGFHKIARADLSAKSIRKRHAFEKLGNIGFLGKKIVTVEYTELSDEEKLARVKGKLLFEQGSIAVYTFSLSFLKRLLNKRVQLPYHLAHKKIPCVSETGNRAKPDREKGIKFEQFIFDTFPFARKVLVLETDRFDFSPIKNKTGEDSPKTARRDLSNLFGSWLEQIGIKIKRRRNGDVAVPIETSPLFAMDAQEFKVKFDPQKFRKPYLFVDNSKRK